MDASNTGLPISPLAKLLQLEEAVLANELLRQHHIITAPVANDKNDLERNTKGFINLLAFDPYYAEFFQSFSHDPLEKAVSCELVSQEQKRHWEEMLRAHYKEAITALLDKAKTRQQKPPLPLTYLRDGDTDNFKNWLEGSNASAVDIRTLTLLQSYGLDKVLGDIEGGAQFSSIPRWHPIEIKLPEESELSKSEGKLNVILDALVYGPWIDVSSDLLGQLVTAEPRNVLEQMQAYIKQCVANELQKFVVPILQPHTPLGALIYGFQKLSSSKEKAVHASMQYQANRMVGLFQLLRTKIAARYVKDDAQRAFIALFGVDPDTDLPKGAKTAGEINKTTVSYVPWGKADPERVAEYLRLVEWQLEVELEERVSLSTETHRAKLEKELRTLFLKEVPLNKEEVIFLLIGLPVYLWLLKECTQELKRKLKMSLGHKKDSTAQYLNNLNLLTITQHDGDTHDSFSLPSPWAREQKPFKADHSLKSLRNDSSTQFFRRLGEPGMAEKIFGRIGLTVKLIGLGHTRNHVCITPDAPEGRLLQDSVNISPMELLTVATKAGAP